MVALPPVISIVVAARTSQSLELDGKPTIENGRETLRLAGRTVSRFSLLGVTWTDALLSFQGDAAVRTRSAASGDRSPWQSLDLEDAVAAGDPDLVAGRTRGGSTGLWSGLERRRGEGRLPAGRASSRLPAGLRLTLVDPGPATSGGQGGGAPLADPEESAPADPPATGTEPLPDPEPEPAQPPAQPDDPSGESSGSATPSAPTTVTAAPPTTAAATPVPTVPAQSAMPAYVSRKGGSADESLVKDAPVYGTTINALFVHHTAQSGSRSNDYTCAQLAAFKLGRYGHDPLDQFTTTAQGSNDKVPVGDEVTMGRIAGHRDVQATECPGNALYGELPALRTETAGVLSGLKITGLSGRKGVVRDSVTVSWSVSTPGGEIGGFDVRVDGRTAGSAAAAARSATVQLAAGRHTVQVQTNRVGGPTSVSDTRTIIADLTRPTFPGRPDVVLRTGTVNPTAAPVTLKWQAADAVGLSAVQLTAPGRTTFATSARSWNTTARPGAATTWRLQATDLAARERVAAAQRRRGAGGRLGPGVRRGLDGRPDPGRPRQASRPGTVDLGAGALSAARPALAGASAAEAYDRIATDLRRLRKLATLRGRGSATCRVSRCPGADAARRPAAVHAPRSGLQPALRWAVSSRSEVIRCVSPAGPRSWRSRWTADSPAARAPSTSSAWLSPTLSTSPGWNPQRAQARRNASACGLATPRSSTVKTGPTRSPRPVRPSFLSCWPREPLVSTAVGRPAATSAVRASATSS
jgi:hypothetical protein